MRKIDRDQREGPTRLHSLRFSSSAWLNFPICPPPPVNFSVRVWDTGFRVQGSGFRVQGSRFRVQGSGPTPREPHIQSRDTRGDSTVRAGRHAEIALQSMEKHRDSTVRAKRHAKTALQEEGDTLADTAL